MGFRKASLLFLITPLLLSGCNNEENKEVFLSNYHYLETILPEEKDRILEGNIENVKQMMTTNISFLIYFHKPDCYWCEKFEPILNSYVSKHETLVIDFPYENISEFKSNFSDVINFDSTFTFPYLGVMHGSKPCERISNESYMQTENVFVNYMESRVKKTHIYYSDKSQKNVKNTRKISSISLDHTDKTAVSLYNTKVYPSLTKSKADILFTCVEEAGLTLSAIDENQIVKEKTQVNNETESNQIERFF